MFFLLSCLFVAALSSPAWKGLTSWLMFVLVTFPCGILGQMGYLIVLIPDLGRLYYFKHILLDNTLIKHANELAII